MTKYITLEVLLNALVLSFVGAMIRILFTKINSFADTFKIFIGSILFGLVVGYSLNDFTQLKDYLKLIVVLFSIFGKELFSWLENFFINPSKNLGIVFKLIQTFQSIKINIKKDDDTH